MLAGGTSNIQPSTSKPEPSPVAEKLLESHLVKLA
jgi:hypothetical protein